MLAEFQSGSRVSAARFSPDGQHLLTGQTNGTLALWRVRPPAFASHLSDPSLNSSKVPDKKLLAHKASVSALAVSVDGNTLASSSNDDTAKVWSLSGGALSATLTGHKEDVNDIVIAPDGKTIITASDDKTIKLWALADSPQAASTAAPADKNPRTKNPRLPARTPLARAHLLTTLEGHQSSVANLVLSADGKTLASTDGRGVVKAWSIPRGLLLATFEEKERELKALAVTPDGKLLATTGNREDTTVKLWNLPEGRLLHTLAGHAKHPSVGAVSPDGRLLAVGMDDYGIRLWEMATGTLIGTLEAPGVTSLVIAPENNVLAASAKDESIRLWSLTDGRLLAVIEDQQRDGYGSSKGTLLFTANGSRLLSLTGNSSVSLWSVPEGRLVAKLQADPATARGMVATPDVKTLACGDSSGAISLWDLEKPAFRTYLFDAAANTPDVKGLSYNVYNQLTGQIITYTLPCGSPIPAGAVCTCNCVPGTDKPYRPSYPRGGGYPSGGGTYCTCNKVCTCIPVPSDRDVKEAFETTDPMTILQRLAELPIRQWNYKWDDSSVRHIGPMAQDFAAAFAVGEDDKHIHPVDAQGVAFAAIQALHQIMKQSEARTEDLQKQLQHHQEERKTLEERIGVLERLANAQLRKTIDCLEGESVRLSIR